MNVGLLLFRVYLGEQEKFSFQYGEVVELEIRTEWKP